MKADSSFSEAIVTLTLKGMMVSFTVFNCIYFFLSVGAGKTLAD